MGLKTRLEESVRSSGAATIARNVRQTWRRFSSDWEQLGWRANDDVAEYYLARICSPNKVFIDGGAHVGSVVREVLAHCPQSTVLAIEAIPEKAERLAVRFPKAIVVACALVENKGPVTFHIDMDHSACSTLAETHGRTRKILVEGLTLNDFASYGDVDVIKLDLEGAEFGALKGGTNLLARDRPIIMYESGPTDVMGYTKGDMFDWLKGMGYAIFLPSRLGKSAPSMSREIYLDAHEYPFHALNYFAVPNERVDEIAGKISEIRVPRIM